MALYADNFFLPLSLLLARTFLPLAVLILFLKPWTLLLCLFLGWYVLSIFSTPPANDLKSICGMDCIRTTMQIRKLISIFTDTVNIIPIMARFVKLFLLSVSKIRDTFQIWSQVRGQAQDAGCSIAKKASNYTGPFGTNEIVLELTEDKSIL